MSNWLNNGVSQSKTVQDPREPRRLLLRTHFFFVSLMRFHSFRAFRCICLCLGFERQHPRCWFSTFFLRVVLSAQTQFCAAQNSTPVTVRKQKTCNYFIICAQKGIGGSVQTQQEMKPTASRSTKESTEKTCRDTWFAAAA